LRTNGDDRWLYGAAFSVFIDRDPDDVFAFLLDLPRTPLWRQHLDEVVWLDDGDVRIGRRIRVITTLAWYRKIEMICEVTDWQPDRRRFAYRVIKGPAYSRNEYRVDAENGGTRFHMQGSVPLDRLHLRLAGPILKRMEDRITRRQVRALKELLETQGDVAKPNGG
jgi:hypothetical protein